MRKRHSGSSVFDVEYTGLVKKKQPTDNSDMKADMNKKHSALGSTPPMKRIGATAATTKRFMPEKLSNTKAGSDVLRDEMKLPAKKRAMGGGLGMAMGKKRPKASLIAKPSFGRKPTMTLRGMRDR